MTPRIFAAVLIHAACTLATVHAQSSDELDNEVLDEAARKKLGVYLVEYRLDSEQTEEQAQATYFEFTVRANLEPDPTTSLQNVQSMLGVLKDVRGLTGIGIMDQRLTTDENLEVISECKQVTAIGIAGDRFTAEGIAALSSLAKLEQLEIEYPCTRHEYLKERMFASKEVRTLPSTGVVAILKECELTCLVLHGVEVDTATAAEISKQKRLRVVKIPCKRLLRQDLKLIASSQSLEIIGLDGRLVGVSTNDLKDMFPDFDVAESQLFDGGYTLKRRRLLNRSAE